MQGRDGVVKHVCCLLFRLIMQFFLAGLFVVLSYERFLQDITNIIRVLRLDSHLHPHVVEAEGIHQVRLIAFDDFGHNGRSLLCSYLVDLLHGFILG